MTSEGEIMGGGECEQLIHPNGATEQWKKWETYRMKIEKISLPCI